MFDSLNKGKFSTRIPDETPYLRLSSCKAGMIFRAWGFYLNTKGKFDNHYNVLVQSENGGNFAVLNLPSYMNETVEQLLGDSVMIAAVNRGECGLKTEEYTDKLNKIQIAVSWVDLEPIKNVD